MNKLVKNMLLIVFSFTFLVSIVEAKPVGFRVNGMVTATQLAKGSVKPRVSLQKIDVKNHVTNAELNRAGKVVGGHSLRGGNVQKVRTIEPADVNGVSKAKIGMKDPNNPSQILEKRRPSTLFPNKWGASMVEKEVKGGKVTKVFKEKGQWKWAGKTRSGVPVAGYVHPKVTVYPVMKK